MARPTKLTPALIERLVELLAQGCIVEQACEHVGISKQTYYNWRNESLRLKAIADQTPTALATQEDVLYLTFLDSITRAQATAQVTAVVALRAGMTASQTVEEFTETVSETRLRRTKDGEQPYVYTKTTVRRRIVHHPADWRAAIEFLKRRDPEHWGDQIKVETWQDRAIADIRAGVIDYHALAEAFDESIAAELFTRAGVPIPLGEGEG